MQLAMAKVGTNQQKSIQAQIRGFNYSAIEGKLVGNVCKNYKQFFGRDYKVLLQIAPFVLCPHLPDDHRQVWLNFCEVCNILVVIIIYYSPLLVRSLELPTKKYTILTIKFNTRASVSSLLAVWKKHSLN